jgi:hypothetical protein
MSPYVLSRAGPEDLYMLVTVVQFLLMVLLARKLKKQVNQLKNCLRPTYRTQPMGSSQPRQLVQLARPAELTQLVPWVQLARLVEGAQLVLAQLVQLVFPVQPAQFMLVQLGTTGATGFYSLVTAIGSCSFNTANATSTSSATIKSKKIGELLRSTQLLHLVRSSTAATGG